MIGPVSAGLGTASGRESPNDAAPAPATDGFDEAAVLVEVAAALAPAGPNTGAARGPKALLADLIQGFDKARRLGREVHRVFAAVKTRLQTFALDLVRERTEALKEWATVSTLLGKTPKAIAEEAEGLARQAKRGAGRTQKAMLREQRLDPFDSLAARIARFRRFDETLGAIARGLRITGFIHRADAETRREDEEARRSEAQVGRSISGMRRLGADPGRYAEPPKLDLWI
jgi:septal ring factor EnvC (AmiA/AmiB activator)